MSKPNLFGTHPNSNPRSRRRRRPSGVSRRRKQLNLSFETLEDRRVMSAQSPVATLQGQSAEDSGWEVTSYSSNTNEGLLEILQRELYLQSLQSTEGNTNLIVNSVPTDPFVGRQWHLINAGQQVGGPDRIQDDFALPGEDINVAPVWNLGLTGDGVVVAVIDTGVDTEHPDLAANIDSNFQIDVIGNDFDANPINVEFNPLNAHGTAVAGVIGAVADNDLGGTGVAPGVQLVPIRLIEGGLGPAGLGQQAIVDAFRFGTDEIDITNNSWGPNVGRTVAGPTVQQFFALRDSVVGDNAGRDGLGIIHIFSAGDNAQLFASEHANLNGWVNSRYTIGVTGVDHNGFYNNFDGTVTGSPEAGSSILVAAPTGSSPLGVLGFINGIDIVNDDGQGSGIITTDTRGDTGFNILPDPTNGEELDRDFEPDERFTSRFGDTSSAAALVSGVVALMLEANPNLSWRDVQEILVRSARQNSPLGEAADGTDKSFSIEHQNTWIQNQIPLYHDPDPWDVTINPILQVYQPTLDPNLVSGISPTGGFVGEATIFSNHYAPSPATLTNGAGYTVSQGYGTNNEWLGYGHGVVDATLAVQLAQQWTDKNQTLPDESTFTTTISSFFDGLVPAAQNTGVNNGNMIVPGGLGGETGFIDYYAEYFDDIPFLEPGELPALLDNPRSRGPLEFIIPDDNTMNIETIEVSLTIDNYAEALDHLRVVLVSPNGTHSELNQYVPEQSLLPALVTQAEAFSNAPTKISPVGTFFDTQGSTGGAQTFTFSTNRSWGERSDSDIIFNPTTGLPVIDTGIGGDAVYNLGEDGVLGDALQQGWQLHFENWGNTDLTVAAIEVAWHGSPIDAETERVQGFVGVDDNRDDFFNYSRLLRDTQSEAFNDDGDPNILRLGEVVNEVDPDQEDFAENVTVTATRVSDGVVVDRFVTGHDGNYYFDLIPDDYIISVEDSFGRTALDDSLTPAGILQDYRAEWRITEDYFRAWNRDSALEVPLDAMGTPQAFLDANGNTVPTGVKGLNFLIDPGAPAAQEVNFSGVIFADTNGDGIFNGDDVIVPDVQVFGDANQNGVFDSGEQLTETNENGEYFLTVPSVAAAVMNVGVRVPFGWTATAPDTALQTFFTQLGDEFSGVDFAIQPPVGQGPTTGSTQPGVILGVVFDDVNSNASRQTSEAGVANVQVYLDNNSSGVLDAGDTVTVTNANGAYIFSDVSVGTHIVRVNLVNTPLVQTFPFPAVNPAFPVTVFGDSTRNGVNFGANNSATLDFGDLPEQYGTLFDSSIHSESEGGPRHTRGPLFLGSLIDSELNGQPTANADGDDNSLTNDDDGITVDPLVAGGFGRVEAIASLQGGFLQGWIDFNGDGDFDDVIEGVPERIFENKRLDVGLNVFEGELGENSGFMIPSTIEATTVYARFRYGKKDLGLTGFASTGEVEDYILDVNVPPLPLVVSDPDFDQDGDVDGADFLTWQRGFGVLTNARTSTGDANNDGAVNGNDLASLLDNYGQAPQALAAVLGDGEGGSSLAASLAPRIEQPGFPEDLDAGVVDTSAFVSGMQSLTAQSSLVTTSLASQFEVIEEEVPSESVDAQANLDFAPLDQAFAYQEQSLESQLSDGVDEEEALAVALGEIIDWRLN